MSWGKNLYRVWEDEDNELIRLAWLVLKIMKSEIELEHMTSQEAQSDINMTVWRKNQAVCDTKMKTEAFTLVGPKKGPITMGG